jgi:hypothetical protein
MLLTGDLMSCAATLANSSKDWFLILRSFTARSRSFVFFFGVQIALPPV